MAMRLLHTLIDPTAAPVLQSPSRVSELLNLARNTWVLPFDEVRKLSPAMASVLNRLSSGIGVTTREAGLPTSEPLLQFFRRPIMMAVTKKWKCPEALAEKSLAFNLAPLAHNQQRTETAIVAEFTAAWPEILAGLATAASTAFAVCPKRKTQRAAVPTHFPGLSPQHPHLAARRTLCVRPSNSRRLELRNRNRRLSEASCPCCWRVSRSCSHQRTGSVIVLPVLTDSRAASRISVTITLFSSELSPDGFNFPRTTAVR